MTVGRRPRPISASQRARYLKTLREGRTKEAAAKAAGRNSRSFRRLAVEDETFAAAVEEAYEEGRGPLVEFATCRALDGWDEPVFQGGKLVGHVHKHDHILLMFLIKQRDPSFRERAAVDVAHSGSFEVTHGDKIDVEIQRLLGEMAARDEAAAAGAVASGAVGEDSSA